jgi:uncharacterized membrane protein
MILTYILHILAGSLSLVFGYVALFSVKGGSVHRRSGMVFVYAMLTMAVFGTLMSMVRGVAPAINIPAGLLTSYLVITALTTLKPPERGARWLHVGLMLMALTVGLADASFAVEAIANGGKRSDGMPAFPFVMFGAVGMVGAAGDFRVLRSGALKGSRRIARHLWRMCFALFIAALSFFIGQARVIPEPIRIPGLLALPVVAVLVAMIYWLWRVRGKGWALTKQKAIA